MTDKTAGPGWGPLLFVALLLAGACAPLPMHTARLEAAKTTGFQYCYNYGCVRRISVSLNADQWAQVTAPLAIPAPDAPAERAAIREAIALSERVIGPMVGTDADIGGWYGKGLHETGQVDCVDEAYNTTTILALLEKDGLLHHHRLRPMATRGILLDLHWFHNTAVIAATASGDLWAVDSWFHDNGVPPEIIPLDDWKAHWHPPVYPLGLAAEVPVGPDSN